MKNYLKNFWGKLIVATICIISFNANATNYYVATNGNDNNNGTSLSSAWRTLQKAANVMQPGDICNVANGNYDPVNINRSGSASGDLTFKSINKWGAKVTSSYSCFYIGESANNVAYITVDGFEMTSPADAVYGTGVYSRKGAHHITARNNWVHGCGSGGIGMQDGDYRTVENNLCVGNGLLFYYGGSGISLFGNYPFDDRPGFHNIVRNNVCYDNDNGPSTAKTDGNGIIIDDFRNTQTSNHIGATNLNYTGSATLVENNLCYNNGGKGIQVFLCNNVTVRNNTLYGNNTRQDQGQWSGELNTSAASNSTFYNNICVTTISIGSGIFSGAFGGDGFSSGLTFYNNLTYSTVNNSSNSVSSNGTTINVIGVNGNKTATNPLFINAGSKDFHLQSSSPALNSGTNSFGLPSTDLDGNNRVQGNAVDIGAYERAGSVTTIAVTGVSLSPTSATVVVNETKQLSSAIAPTNASNQNVAWSSSNTAVATVNASGLVTGVSIGNATITVTTQDGNKTATTSITVNTASTNTVNSIEIVSAPSSITQTSTNAIQVKYSASQSGSVWVGLFDSNWAYVGGTTNYNVNANTNGTITINSSVSNIAVGTGYKWYVELRDSNNTGISGTGKTQDNVKVVANTTVAADLTIQVESFCTKNNVNSWSTGAGGFGSGGYLKYCNVNLGTGYNTLKMSLATKISGKFNIRKGSATGTIIGTLNFTQTGDWNTFNTQSCTLNGASGIQDIFITTDTNTANVDYIVFTNVNSTVRNTDATNLKESVITFPNPATYQLNVNYKLTSDSTVNVSLYDMSGNKVKSSTKKQTQGDQTLSIETTDVKNGLYFIKITANGQEATKKVMIKN